MGPGEIVIVTPDSIHTLAAPGKDMKICTFLWVYYGYPSSSYEGISVEEMRYRCGSLLAKRDDIKPDIVAGVPDSGTAHAIGYSNESGIPFSRPFIKYTPTWPVRGTQMRETTEFLYQSGAKEVHIRPACPPLLYGCKYLNFSRSTSEMDLITRQVLKELEREGRYTRLEAYSNPETEEYKEMVKRVGEKLNFTSLRYHRLDDMIESVGIDRCKLCTYCWDGKE